MQNKFSRLIAFLLVVASLVSMLTVFAYAEEGDSGETEEPQDELTVVLNRTFNEGWNFTNGFSDANKGNNYVIKEEEDPDTGYNYYIHMEALNEKDGFLEMQYPGEAQPTSLLGGYAFLEFDIRVEDWMNVQQVLYCRAPGGVTRPSLSLLSFVNNEYKVFGQSTGVQASDEWYHFAYIFAFSATEDQVVQPTQVTAILAPRELFSDESARKTVTTTWQGDGLDIFRFGFQGRSADNPELGTYGLDNVKIYNRTLVGELCDIPADNYGLKVNLDGAKTIEIRTNDGAESEATYLNNALVMKVGVNYALLRGERTAILYWDAENETNVEYDATDRSKTAYGAPVKVNGKVYVPLQPLLDYIGLPLYVHADGLSYDIATATGATYLTIGRDSATVDGKRVPLSAAPDAVIDENGLSYVVIAMDDVHTLFSNYYVTYDDMGLIIICQKENIINRKNQLGNMLQLMRKFVFDYAQGADVAADVKKNTNGFQHPYLIATQEKFDEMYKVFNATEGDPFYDKDYLGYLTSLKNTADNYLANYVEEVPEGDVPGDHAWQDSTGKWYRIKDQYYVLTEKALDENGNPILDTNKNYVYTVDNRGRTSFPYLLVNPWGESGNNGYDPDGGRLTIAGTTLSGLYPVAIAYYLTNDEAYAHLAYEYVKSVGSWIQWGPGHFLDCADASAPFALIFDWLYNPWKQMGKDLDLLASQLYNNGVHQGYCNTKNGKSNFPRAQGDSGNWSSATNNWNAVCSSGMMIASLMLLEWCDKEGNTYAEETYWLINLILVKLPEYGLDEYAPDGGYIESPSYWNYGTNTLFRMIWAMDTACGDDYGLMDCWGLDQTCYYACQTEFSYYQTASKRYHMFNFHDSGGGAQDTSFFYFVGGYLGDEGLIALRKQQLNNGKSSSLFDALGYKLEYSKISYDNITLDLDYWAQGIDLYTMRSGWENGALFTGFMGSPNDCSHADVDSGNFIYANKGIYWLIDLGSENYNTFEYFGGTRYYYYRKNAEGQNTICLTSQQTQVPYGQIGTAGGTIEETFTNEHGSYALLDQTDVFGKYVSSATRGLMLTGDRKVTVIQDEINFNGVQEAYWFVHTQSTITLANEGKTAYLVSKSLMDGKEYCLRLSIVSPSSKYVFEKMTTYDMVLNVTRQPGDSEKLGGVPEASRNGINKLAIKNVGLSFEVAVVIELVDNMAEDDPTKVGYTWSRMADWEPAANSGGTIDSDDNEEENTPAQITDIVTYTKRAGQAVAMGWALTSRILDFYNNLSRVQKALDVYRVGSELFNETPGVKASYQEYLTYLEQYEAYQDTVNGAIASAKFLTDAMSGLTN